MLMVPLQRGPTPWIPRCRSICLWNRAARRRALAVTAQVGARKTRDSSSRLDRAVSGPQPLPHSRRPPIQKQARPHASSAPGAARPGAVSRMGAWAARPRREAARAPSSADPSALLRAELGDETRVETEEDVLHLKRAPSFDGALRPRESELLLQYLTVPYLRVPLLLRFFSEPRTHAFGAPKLQAALDAALFEPGLWQADASKSCRPAHPGARAARTSPRRPASSSTSSRGAHRHLRVDPQPHRIRARARLAAGTTRRSANCAASLYVLRVAARVDGFVRTVLAANDHTELELLGGKARRRRRLLSAALATLAAARLLR